MLRVHLFGLRFFKLAAFMLAAALCITSAFEGAVQGGVPARSQLQLQRPPLRFTTILVADTADGAVLEYSAGSKGSVKPIRRFRLDPRCGPTDVWGIATGPHGSIYTQSFIGESCTRVLNAGVANRTFRGDGRDSPAIAVDDTGGTYVARILLPTVEFFRASATGKVRADRTIPIDGAPRSLTLNDLGELTVAVQNRNGHTAIESFQTGPRGSASPVRKLSGGRTGLGSAAWFDAPVILTASHLTHRLYVAVSGTAANADLGTGKTPTKILVFAQKARGNTVPLRIIQGGNTQLDGTTITGIATDPRTGAIYVLATRSAPGTHFGQILVFGRYAHGNAYPIGRFTDPNAQFGFANGITISDHSG